MSRFQSTKVIELGSCAFRQPNAAHNRPGAGENSARCSFVHGYKLTAKFWFGCSELDDKNWAVDFGGLKDLKKILQNQFDHTLCIDRADPLLPLFQELHKAGGCDLRIMENGVGIERTAEYCFDVADRFVRSSTQDRCWVEQVEVFEHESNSAIFTRKEAAAQSSIETQEPKTSQEPAITTAPSTNNSTDQRARTPAHVGPNTSSGKGDWFKGTTWA